MDALIVWANIISNLWQESVFSAILQSRIAMNVNSMKITNLLVYYVSIIMESMKIPALSAMNHAKYVIKIIHA